MSDLFFELLQISLGTRDQLSRVPDAQEWGRLYIFSLQQAVAGVIMGGLSRLPDAQLPPQAVKLQWIGVAHTIEQDNKTINNAVVSLCRESKEMDIQMLVFNGQTLAAIYPNPGLRQSGDIDYYVRKEAWQKAIDGLARRFKCGIISDYVDYTTEKDVQYHCDNIVYEMHKSMLSLASDRKPYLIPSKRDRLEEASAVAMM